MFFFPWNHSIRRSPRHRAFHHPPTFSCMQNSQGTIPLKDLPLPPDLEKDTDTNSSPVTLMDLLVQLWEACAETRAYAQATHFVGRVRSGEMKAMVIAGATVIIGSMIMYRLFFADDDADGDAAAARAKAAAEEEKKKNEVEQRDFTVEQLRHFDGKDNKPIYIALKGDVFDVSSARQFYGEGSGYVLRSSVWLLCCFSVSRLLSLVKLLWWQVQLLCRPGRDAGHGQAVVRRKRPGQQPHRRPRSF